jgi:hypothetical protein
VTQVAAVVAALEVLMHHLTVVLAETMVHKV